MKKHDGNERQMKNAILIVSLDYRGGRLVNLRAMSLSSDWNLYVEALSW